MTSRSASDTPKAVPVKTQKLFLYSFIFLLYLTYRGFYWQDSLPDQWVQVLLNVVMDTSIVLVLSIIHNQVQRRFEHRLVLVASWLFLSLAGCFALIGLHYLVHTLTGSMHGRFEETFYLATFQVFDALVVVMIGFSMSTAFSVFSKWMEARLQIERLEKDKAIAEINYLKSQINPHFVFNTLNSIYFLIHEHNEDARFALQKFSEMLRYQLYESNTPRVPIEEEIRYLESYVELQKLRLEKDCDIQLNIAEDVHSFQIPPMLLIIPIENAFKYISYDLDTNYVHIEMTRNNGRFNCTVRNSTDKNSEKNSIGGIGLGNLKRRLELLYNGESSFEVVKNPGSFEVRLSLKA